MFKVNNRHQNILDCIFINNKFHFVNVKQANADWGKYLWHEGLIKSFAFTHTFPRICAMHLVAAIHSVFFLQFLTFAYVKAGGNN